MDDDSKKSPSFEEKDKAESNSKQSKVEVSNAQVSLPNVRKSKDLRAATHHLCEEALRRYRLKHQSSWEDWSPDTAPESSSSNNQSLGQKHQPLPSISPRSSDTSSEAVALPRQASNELLKLPAIKTPPNSGSAAESSLLPESPTVSSVDSPSRAPEKDRNKSKQLIAQNSVYKKNVSDEGITEVITVRAEGVVKAPDQEHDSQQVNSFNSSDKSAEGDSEIQDAREFDDHEETLTRTSDEESVSPAEIAETAPDKPDTHDDQPEIDDGVPGPLLAEGSDVLVTHDIPGTPIDQPGTPAEQPETPAEQPETPAEQPETPAEQPETPAEQPDTPAEQPETPAELPGTPDYEHGKPDDQPGTSADETGTLGGEVGESANKPETDHEPGSPVDDGDKPIKTLRVDEEEEQVVETHKKEEVKKIDDEFFYNYEDHVSKARVSADSGLPGDWISLHHSFGYDCTKRNNLQLLDQENVCFVAGNSVQILNLKTKSQVYIRSTSGGGIGAIAIHPSTQYLAIGEKGEAPNINVYEYPSLKLYRILRGGTEEQYSYLDFSPDGKLLASVGGDPDYMLTIWNWQQEQIVLRSKAFSQDVYRVTFSTELDGQLTSSGVNHIRFWKMADTFTGLKLQGQIGKFGRTEITDIEGYVELPDGKVLSGSEWGNMLLWDGGLIKVEISRKNRKLCHQGSIQQIVMDEGELMTIGVDGCIRAWDFETIDTADTSDDNAVFEMEPMNELVVGDVNLRVIIKSLDPDEPTVWFAQDAKGGIWKLDLSFSHTSMAPERLMSYTAGAILACNRSPVDQLVATGGADGSVRVYDCSQKQQLTEIKYNSPTTSLLWVPEVVDPKGSTILAGFEDGVVRVLRFLARSDIDSVSRHRLKQFAHLLLFQAMKPHNGKVTTMAIDSTGEVLATGSDDCTIFFLSVGNAKTDDFYEPIGFMTLPAPIVQVQWSPPEFDKSRLLVLMQHGLVWDIECPEPGNYDTSKTFQLSGLSTRSFQFTSVKSKLRHDEELERMAKEEAERKAAEEEERRKRIERGMELDEPREEKKVEPDFEWVPFTPEVPSPILHGFYGKDESVFWLSMGDYDAGYLYECKFLSDDERAHLTEEQQSQPLRAIPINDSSDVPITDIKFSSNGQIAFMGLANGSIRIQPLESSDLSTLGPHYTLPVHDNHYGHVVAVAVTYDDRYLCSVGKDGNFFCFQIMDEESVKKAVSDHKAKIPSAKASLEQLRVDDIDDPTAYSIEDAKQKAEYDRMLSLAEEAKQNVRRQISQLRMKFKKMVWSNEELPKHLQLSRREFEMDPGIKRELEKQTQDKIDQVRKELAWEAEKHKLALEKLRVRFMDVVECERIVVRAFNSNHEVCSFRSSKLSDDFYALRNDMEQRKIAFLTRDDLSHDASKDAGKDAAKLAQFDPNQSDNDSKDSKITTTLKGSKGERITKALNKVEEKKKKRAQRKAQWDELFATKPEESYEDPADVAAITEAKENMGDYKLKTADDYVVPDHLRLNVDKARTKLLQIKDLIHQHKYDFNQHLLALRDRKIQIIEEVVEIVNELIDVQAELGPDKSRPLPDIPEMLVDEMPEKKLEYTREILKKFKKFVEERTIKEIKGGAESGFGQSGSFVDAGQALNGLFGIGVKIMPSNPLKSPITDTSVQQDQTEAETKRTPLEMKLKRARDIKLEYEQNKLFEKMDHLLRTFDAQLRLLNHEKFQLDIDLKNADLRHVTLFEELVLLKEFEKREDILAAKVENKKLEKIDMQTKLLECQAKLESKKKDIDKFMEKEKALYTQFQASLGDGNKFGDYLTKVFKKRIKRSKKKATESESDEESEEESDDESDFSEDEDESDSETGGHDLDVCPSGCDQTLYDATCQLREKRLDIEEDLTEEKKANEAMKKELDNLQRKAKVIESNLKTAEADLEAFQLEKQRKINELDVVVTLKLHQIQYVLNSVLPNDLSPCLVFEAPGLTQLHNRIKELEHEKLLQKRHKKEAKKKHVQLIKDRKTFEKRIAEMEESCNEMMVHKFGVIVDLEKLETVTVNRQLEELKERLQQVEEECAAEIWRWDMKLEEKRDFITQLVRQNTQRLQQLHMLTDEKLDYERDLDSKHKTLGSEFTGNRKADIHERQRLIQLVQLQAQEVDALKDEINLLSRKGGHILPPAQPPMSGSHHHPISVANQ